MTRYVIDAPTLLHLVANNVQISRKLQADALVTVTALLSAKAKDVVPLAGLKALTADQD